MTGPGTTHQRGPARATAKRAGDTPAYDQLHDLCQRRGWPLALALYTWPAPSGDGWLDAGPATLVLEVHAPARAIVMQVPPGWPLDHAASHLLRILQAAL